MRLLKNLAAAAAVASLAVAPVMAQAGSASKLSLRGSTKAKKSSQVMSPLVPLVFVAVMVGGIVIASESGSDSP